ncbi:hypothetical protein QBZ16_005026 [Prototheca wickerhamii]|uniref:AP2/ERF domain-containing protein n=1 Tax=Prototheca wickerhamii TaxID=3111 RepID=A0AAD9MJN2_PROWI|nr:hypothetical protein QBZ16_005026 [Prototheca wickerhamii]
MNYMAQEGLDDAVGDPEFRYDVIGAFRNVTASGGNGPAQRQRAAERRQVSGSRGGPSKYRGVVWHKSNCKWEARIYEGGKQKFLGYYVSEDAAAHAYDEYAVRLHGNLSKLNFPELYAGGERPGGDPSGCAPGAAPRAPSAARTASPRAPRQRVQPVKGTSRFRGVSWNSNCAKWRAQVWKASEVHHLGYFEGEEDAARAYDEAVLRIRGPDAPTNFPRSDYLRGVTDSAPVSAAAHASSFRGVSWSERHAAWVAELWDGERFRLLGVFQSEVAAARRYDVACLELHGAEALTNFPVTAYEAELAALTLRDLASASDAPSDEEETEAMDVGVEAAAPRPPVRGFAATSRAAGTPSPCGDAGARGGKDPAVSSSARPADSGDSSASTAPRQEQAPAPVPGTPLSVRTLLASPDALHRVLSAIATVRGGQSGASGSPAAAWAAALAQRGLSMSPYAA